MNKSQSSLQSLSSLQSPQGRSSLQSRTSLQSPEIIKNLRTSQINEYVKFLHNLSIQNHRKIERLNKLVNALYKGRKVYKGKRGGYYYKHNNTKVYL